MRVELSPMPVRDARSKGHPAKLWGSATLLCVSEDEDWYLTSGLGGLSRSCDDGIENQARHM